jgi:PAS domain S-box-containing protein
MPPVSTQSFGEVPDQAQGSRPLISREIPNHPDSGWQKLVAQAPFSVQTFHPDGRVKTVNAAWERLFGVTLADLPDYNILHDPQLETHGILPAIRQAFQGGPQCLPPISYVPHLGQYQGQRRWCGAYIYPLKDDAGQVREVVLVHLDVSEQQEAREKLILYREIFTHTTDAIGIVNPQWQFLEQNEAHARLTGYSDDEIKGHTPALQIGQAAFDLVSSSLTMQGSFTGEVVCRTREQGDVPVDLAAFAVKDPLGHPICYVLVKRDIRDRKRAEEEREYLLVAERAARAEAERANRVKDDFLATLSHELRTPLNAILGWCQLLRAAGPASAHAGDIDEAIDVIERNTRVQAEIISDLLDMSRIREGKLRLEMARVDLAEVVKAAVNTVKGSADAKHVHIETILDVSDCPAGALTVVGDFSRLQQVVWNLLSNGIKFTPPSGTVRVTLRCPDHHAEMVVSDTGPGISGDFSPYLFERFRQADSSTARRHGGLGLGLAIVKSLVEMHNGTVAVRSPGELGGATFTVKLPLGATPDLSPDQPATQTLPPLNLIAAAPLAGVKILALDDEPDARRLIKRLLEMAGAVTTVAASVGEALEALDAFRPDLVLSDISLPGMDGYEFIRAVRTLGPTIRDVPAIALTAFARPEDRQRALDSGFNEHVPKPVEPTALVALIAKLARSPRE